jgi:hypothetical protein
LSGETVSSSDDMDDMAVLDGYGEMAISVGTPAEPP